MENENLLKDKYRKNIQYIIDKNKKTYSGGLICLTYYLI